VNLMVIQEPVDVGVGLVIFDQVSGKAGSQFRRRVFPGMDGSGDEQLGLVPGDAFVRQTQDVHVIAVRLPNALLPRVADVGPFRQVWIGGRQRGAVGIKLFHCAVAVIWRRQSFETLTCEHIQLAVVGGLLLIQNDGEAHALDGGNF